jgi:hypothetical protein
MLTTVKAKPWVVLALGVALACGGTTRSNDRRIVDDPDGSAGAGGEMNGTSDSGTSPGGSGSNEGGLATGGTFSPDGAGGSYGVAGGLTESGGGTGTGGTGAGGAPVCKVPTRPIPTGTAEEQERAAVIHDFCVTAARDGCIGQMGGSSYISDLLSEQCSDADRLRACEQDQLYQYIQQVEPPCHAAWRVAMICGAGASFVDACNSAALSGDSSRDDMPCRREKEAFWACVNENTTWDDVTGSRAKCSFGAGAFSPCEVACEVGDNFFSLECGGPAGVPLRCGCAVNGQFINEGDFDFYQTIYADDCEAAARLAADGECTNRLDCCFEYPNGDETLCRCGSDPRKLGHETCEALASSVDGRVVPICPQYEFEPGACWPPPCAP